MDYELFKANIMFKLIKSRFLIKSFNFNIISIMINIVTKNLIY